MTGRMYIIIIAAAIIGAIAAYAVTRLLGLEGNAAVAGGAGGGVAGGLAAMFASKKKR